jgi:NADPH2:quinone reductase
MRAADPAPPAGAVRIRVAMAGVIFTDTERRRGLNAEVRLPWIPGTEAAGIVDSVADDVDTGLVGRRVAVGHLARAPRASRGRARARRVPTEAKAALVRALGADAACVTEHALAGVRGLTDGRGVDVVLDSVGREPRPAAPARQFTVTGTVAPSVHLNASDSAECVALQPPPAWS